MLDRFRKRIEKKAKRGFRGYPVATIAFYGPDLSRASKVAVGIIFVEGGSADELRAWFSEDSDVRRDAAIFEKITDYIDQHGAHSVAMRGGIIGCPHQEGVDYEGEWCPVCDFWKGRDRFTGEMVE